MATLTGDQIAELVIKVGWLPHNSGDVEHVKTATSIALAESGGRTDAISPTGDYGLWQINKNAHAGLFTKYKWDDPTDNARMAKEVWEAAGKSFKPWVTYNNGSYKGQWNVPHASLGDSIKNGPKIIAGAAGSVVQAIPGVNAISAPAKILSGALGDVFKFVTQGFVTIGAFLLALALLLLGAWWLVKDTDAGRKVKEGAEAAVVAGVTKGAV